MANSIFTINVPSKSDDNVQTNYTSGFYYDNELNNPLTRVTLHANKEYDANGLKPVKNEKGEETSIPPDGPWVPINGDKDEDGYSVIPIATSIYTDDFSFDIASTYSDFGGDPIGEYWNSQKAMAPYSNMVADALKSISKTTKEHYENGNGAKYTWADFGSQLATAMGKMAEKTSKMSSLRGRSLHVRGTQFSYFQGTGISFNNMSMKFTLLSDWENGKFVSIKDKLTGDSGFPLLAYVIGDFVDVTEFGNEKGFEELHKFVGEWCSWQLPPGGFKANLRNIDEDNEGTLKLRFGPYFSLTNLVISGCSINISKNMIRNPVTDGIVPMSCDVALQFRPAAKYSKRTLDKVLKGDVSKIRYKKPQSGDVEEEDYKTRVENNLKRNYVSTQQ